MVGGGPSGLELKADGGPTGGADAVLKADDVLAFGNVDGGYGAGNC